MHVYLANSNPQTLDSNAKLSQLGYAFGFFDGGGQELASLNIVSEMNIRKVR